VNVGNALGFPSAVSSVKRNDTKVAKDGDTTRSANATQNAAQFTAFLSMLVANDPKLRNDLIKQLPEENAGLIDHLLSEGEVEAGETTDVFAGASMNAQAGTAAVDSQIGNANAAMAREQAAAIDSVRYGMISESASRGEVAETPAPVVEAAPAPKAAPAVKADYSITKAEKLALQQAVAREIVSSMNSGTLSNGTLGEWDANGINTRTPSLGNNSRIPQELLAAVTSRNGSRIEELLAVGDHKSAALKTAINNLIDKSGTEEGLKLAETHAATSAASAALSAALAASAADPSKPVKDVEALDPELRARLNRVIDRMQNEYGHSVTVVETARSQERQDTLFAQGRTTPGNIVTWTQHSNHTQGAAVDVIVDGSWQNAKGFSRLQEIAVEEGLETLGAKDPGHLQLPGELRTLSGGARMTGFSSTPAAQSNNGIAQVATVATVAQVGVAANIAANSANIAPALQNAPSAPKAPQLMNTNGAAGLAPVQPNAVNSNANAGRSDADSASMGGEKNSQKSSLKSHDKADARAAAAAYQETSTERAARFVGPVDETMQSNTTSAADAVDRVDSVNNIRATQGSKQISQMKLEVEGINGETQKITVDVRGKSVGAQISTDGASAERLRANVNELKTGLEKAGLEADSVRISSQGARAESVDGAKHAATIDRDALRLGGAAGTGNASMHDQSAQQGARDRSSAARDWEDKQASRDEQRAQNRDAQGRGSGNQDRQRPQYQEKK
jgi:hypothetical protein